MKIKFINALAVVAMSAGMFFSPGVANAQAPDLRQIITSSLPSLDEPVDLTAVPNGMATVNLNINRTDVTVNMSCTAEVELKHNDETIKTVSVNDKANDDGKYVMMNPYGTPHKIVLAFSYDKNIGAWGGFNPITEPGAYQIIIPDGMFLQDGVEMTGCTLDYTIPAGTPELREIITSSLPSLDEPVDLTAVPNGMASVNLNINRTDVTVNMACTAEVVLKHNDETIKTVSVNDKANDDGKYVMMNPYGTPHKIVLAFSYDKNIGAWGGFNPITEPGAYQIIIPDGMFLQDGVEMTGCTLDYTIEGTIEPEKIELGSIVTSYLPELGGTLNLDENPNGLATVNMNLSRTDVTVNADCGATIDLVYNDNVIHSVKASDTSALVNTNGKYVMVNTYSTPNRIIVCFAFDPSQGQFGAIVPITEAGKYQVVIPDGMFLADGEEVLGMTLDYEIAEVLEPVDFVEHISTCAPPYDKTFNAIDEYSSGVGFIKLTLDKGVALDNSCRQFLTLSKIDETTGEATQLYKIKSSNTYFDDSYVQVTPKGDATELLVIFTFNAIADKGQYTVDIPEGFFTLDGAQNLPCKLNFYLGVKPTGVESPEAEEGMRMLFRLDGSRAAEDEKGLIIVNGKKVVRK